MSSTYNYSDTGSLLKHRDKEESRQLRYFSFFAALSQAFGFIMIFLVGYWCATWNEGYSWGKGKSGNGKYHYTLMTTGLVFLQGEAILIYRLFRHEKKIFSKVIHAMFHLIVFVLYIVGFIAMVHHKQYTGDANMFSGHSWTGISIMVVFIVQYLAGFVNFAFPKTSSEVRSWFLPVHRAFGLIIFAVSCAQALMGFMQETVELQGEPQFKRCFQAMNCHGGEGVVLNLIVVFIVLYGVSVVHLATNRKYIRQSTPDEMNH